jgi:cytochrome P450
MALSRQQALAVFRALLAPADTLELVGEPVRAFNSVTRRLASVPVRVGVARKTTDLISV